MKDHSAVYDRLTSKPRGDFFSSSAIQRTRPASPKRKRAGDTGKRLGLASKYTERMSK
ncbi:hypothetical protein [Fodinibius roseus]|uniref:hypothetical protein n=1 Tax=Fodinibius roseus TaxID=1194090 RepID=UPI00147C7E62|nr:hypothetical protein [Fodinibius roseus]